MTDLSTGTTSSIQGAEPMLGIQPNLFAGIKIVFSDNALERTNEPMRTHKWNGRRETKAYHLRIQKKWIKRFGYVYKPVIYQTPNGFIAHPSYQSEIERVIPRHPLRSTQ